MSLPYKDYKKVIPVLRIFDYKKTVEFYVDWLGFKIDWEHRFEENLPLYIQVSIGDIALHLSEHHGDCTPGGKVFIVIDNLQEYYENLLSKNYNYYRPAIEKAPWRAMTMQVQDPFENKLLFNEYDDNEKTKA